MAKFKILLLLSALFSVLGLQAKESIAVWITSDSETPDAYKNVIATSVTQAINDDGYFTAVERVNEFLAALNSEITFQQSGAVSQDMLVELGKQNGANYVFAISLSKVFDETYASSRIINVEKNAVEAAYGESKPLTSMASLKSLANGIASGTLAKMPYNVEKQKEAEQKRLKEQKEREEKKAEEKKKWNTYNSYYTCRVTSGRELHNVNINSHIATYSEALDWIRACEDLERSVRYPIICDVSTREESKSHYGMISWTVIKSKHDFDCFTINRWKKKDDLENEIVGNVLYKRY